MGKKYPKIALSWRSHWPNLSTYFKYPQEVRTLIYTTNAIENFNRQLRKVTKPISGLFCRLWLHYVFDTPFLFLFLGIIKSARAYDPCAFLMYKNYFWLNTCPAFRPVRRPASQHPFPRGCL